MRNIVQIANDPEFWRTCYGDAYLFAHEKEVKVKEETDVSGKCIYCEKPGKSLCDECYGLKQRDITNMSCPDCDCDEVRYNQVENIWRCLSCGAEWNWLW